MYNNDTITWIGSSREGVQAVHAREDAYLARLAQEAREEDKRLAMRIV